MKNCIPSIPGAYKSLKVVHPERLSCLDEQIPQAWWNPELHASVAL